ncbi:ABC transporter permease subunit [Mesorhizobium sp. M1339]|uniref:ABC transporter permease subunit n=1 Tax=Mesorhizobium sp. M1339 TaxID=2957086 RepID=UPI003334CBFB
MKKIQIFGRNPTWLTVPALAVLLVVFSVPLIQLFLTSLNVPAFSLANYQAFFSRPAYVRVLLQTVEISVVATAICLIIGYPMAYLMVAGSKQLRMTLIALVIIPYLTSGLVRTYAWIAILGDRGLINNLFLSLGIISSPLPLIYNRAAVYIGMVHIMLPMMILPLVSSMIGVDKSLVAAARSMGARPFTAFWRVFLPLTLPGIRSGCLLVFVVCLGFYITPAALGGLGDAMLSNFISSQMATSFNFAPAATASFILLAVAVLVLSFVGLDLAGTPAGGAKPGWKSYFGRLTVSHRLKRYFDKIGTRRRASQWAAGLYRAGDPNRLAKVAGFVFVILVLFYLLFPEILVVVMSFGAGSFLEFPPSGLSLQWYRNFFGDPSWNGAALNSIQIGIVVALFATFIGTIAAYGLSRVQPRVRGLLNMVILTPITIPVIVVGIAAYLGLSDYGLIGSKAGIVLAHSLGAISYVVVIVSATLTNFDRRLEQAAMSMRAGPARAFWRVTLPLIRPGIIGGAFFAFLHSFDEVVITSLVSGFAIRTLPLKMWENIRNQIDPTIAAVASLLILLPVLWLVILYFAWWRAQPSARVLDQTTAKNLGDS